MRKLLTGSICSLPFIAAALLILPFLSGCKSARNGVMTALGDRAIGVAGLPSGSPLDSSHLALPRGREEIWFIARHSQSQQLNNETPGSGSLLTQINEQEIPLPLKHTEVNAHIQGCIGTVEVAQQFHNPYSSKIEAVYVFPLPHDAAVNGFLMTIGDRRIRGIIRERKEAEQLYQEARRQGYLASLLTEERPNIFTQSVANIEPGKEILVNLKYFHTLAYVDGWYEFVFPMVVGPRFNPPGTTNGIGAVARGNAGASQQATEIQYLKPGEDSGHDIALTVDLNAGVPIEEFECKTHEINHRSLAPEHLLVSLAPADCLPNRDFIFRYRVADAHIKSNLLTHKDQRGGYFSLMLYPPRELESLPRQPLEIVFVLDCSGSMNGRPIEQAKAAVRRGLQFLQPEDSFQLITFSMRASQFGVQPLAATPANIRRALEYLASLQGEGGTMMIEGIKAALDFPHDPERLRFVCFLTDGYIGNETEILGAVHERLGTSRIFSFGIGSAVNRYLIENLGKVGRGAIAFLGPNDEAAQVMEDFFSRISHPALTDIKIDWGKLNPSEVYPRSIPDLFVGRPLILAGRFSGNPDSTVRVTGTAGGERISLNVPLTTPSEYESTRALPTVWARMKIAELADEATFSPNSALPSRIKQIALDYGLMSSFTAFIAVDSTRRTEGGEGTSVAVPIPVPEGVEYETTLEEN